MKDLGEDEGFIVSGRVALLGSDSEYLVMKSNFPIRPISALNMCPCLVAISPLAILRIGDGSKVVNKLCVYVVFECRSQHSTIC